MSNFISRNLLICVLPAAIALFSVYWFRRKKKLKTGAIPLPNVQVGGDEGKLDLTDCSSDAADTLSDASSFTSPENSEKSPRIHKFSLDVLSEDIIAKKVSDCESHGVPESEENSHKNSSPPTKATYLCNIKDLPYSGILQFAEKVDNSVYSKSDVNNAALKSSDLDNLDLSKTFGSSSMLKNSFFEENVESDADLKILSEKESIPNGKEFSDGDDLCNHHPADMNAADLLLKMMGYKDRKVHVIENGSLHSIDSNDSATSPQVSDFEKMHTVETDSNDSHSSVLDENSLSYTSDDSDSRQLAELKNKDSPSSVLDENSILSSLCDESEKSSHASPFAKSPLKEEGMGKLAESELPVTNLLELLQSPEKKFETECEIVANAAPPNEAQTPNCVENKCSNSQVLRNSVQITPRKSPDSVHSIVLPLEPVSKSPDSIHTVVLPLEPVLKFPDTNSSTTSQRHVPESLSLGKALEICDSAIEFDYIPSSDEKVLPKSFVCLSDDTPRDSVDVPISSDDPSHSAASEPELSPVPDQLTDESSRLKPDEKPRVEDAQILEMDILGHMQSRTVQQEVENSSESSHWEIEDTHCKVLNQSKSEESDEAGLKVPEGSSNQYVYEFELPQELCGRLIGKHGKHVKSIKDRSHANVYIKRHPYDPQLKIVVVEGNRSDVNDALEIIRRKYPPSRYPTVTLVKTNMISTTNVLPESLQLHLPEGASCDVILSSLVSAGHFFLQQPTHPTYPSLSTLDQCMINCYSQLDTPLLPHPVEAGVICAAPVLRGWYRAQVIYVYENEIECDLKFVDYGGFSQAPTSSLRQIRSDFMSLPFQASECYLANVRPVDPAEGWSAEATSTFEELAQGQILQALLVEYATDGIPCVHLYRVQGISSMFINRELVERGLAVWVNNSHWDPH